MSGKDSIPEWIEPMKAASDCTTRALDDYDLELKWDGYRCIAVWDGERTKLTSRNRLDLGERFPALADSMSVLSCGPVVLDGEIVVLRPDGGTDFGLLQRAAKDPGVPLSYLAFDLLYSDDRLTVDLPYRSRRELLCSLDFDSAVVQVPSAVAGDLDFALSLATGIGLEGVVAKRRDSTYQPGRRSKDWCKIKVSARQELVVGGWTPRRGGSKSSIGALLVGYYTHSTGPPTLHFAGSVGSGFSDDEAQMLSKRLQTLEVPDSPFAGEVDRPGALFVRPELVAEVQFREWTGDGLLRQASYKGLRDDKKATEVVLEPSSWATTTKK